MKEHSTLICLSKKKTNRWREYFSTEYIEQEILKTFARSQEYLLMISFKKLCDKKEGKCDFQRLFYYWDWSILFTTSIFLFLFNKTLTLFGIQENIKRILLSTLRLKG